MIPRIYQELDKYLEPNKVVVIYGPRQAGKTTLIQNYLTQTKFKYRLSSGDDLQVQEVLSSQDFSKILPFAKGFDLLVFDEAQKIPNIGMGLKILVDHVPGIRIIATGSSSFELAGQIGEPLTGRKVTLTLYPVSQIELQKLYNPFDLKNKLEEYLVYGGGSAVVFFSG